MAPADGPMAVRRLSRLPPSSLVKRGSNTKLLVHAAASSLAAEPFAYYLKEMCKELGVSQSGSKSELVARVEKAAREAMGVEGGSAGAEAEDEDGSDRGGFSDGSGSGSDDDVPKGRPDWFDACLY